MAGPRGLSWAREGRALSGSCPAHLSQAARMSLGVARPFLARLRTWSLRAGKQQRRVRGRPRAGGRLAMHWRGGRLRALL